MRNALVLAAMLVACTKPKDDGKPKGDVPSTTAPVTAGDGGSKASPLALVMGKPAEGTLGCHGSPWFLVPPLEEGTLVKYELRIPAGAEQLCTHLNARDPGGVVKDSTVSLCSDNAAAFATGQGPIYGEPRFFTIDKNGEDKCVAARYRVTLMSGRVK